jgi:hypothetical protein
MSTERSAADTVSAGIGDRDAETILRALRDNPGGMSRHEIRRRLFSGNKPAESIASMLATLQRLGLVRSQRIKTTGRPSQCWYAVNAESQSPVVCPPSDTSPVEPEPAPLVPHVADDRDDRRRCATEHLAALGQQGGHGPAWDAARTLIQGLGLTVDEAFPLIAEWNRTCRFVLADFDLRWKLSLMARDWVGRSRGSGPGISSALNDSPGP